MRPELTAINVRKALLESRRTFRPWREAQWLLEEVISRGSDLTPVLVTGSASFEFEQRSNMQTACQALGGILRSSHRIALLTGGMPGVGQAVGEAFFAEEPKGAQLLHVLPKGCDVKEPACGDTFCLGSNFPERQLILGMSAKVNCVIGGGPGTLREAATTLASGGYVLPIGCTGGAAAGMVFDLPEFMERTIDMNLAKSRAIDCGFLSESEWADLTSDDGSPGHAARIIFRALTRSD